MVRTFAQRLALVLLSIGCASPTSSFDELDAIRAGKADGSIEPADLGELHLGRPAYTRLDERLAQWSFELSDDARVSLRAVPGDPSLPIDARPYVTFGMYLVRYDGAEELIDAVEGEWIPALEDMRLEPGRYFVGVFRSEEDAGLEVTLNSECAGDGCTPPFDGDPWAAARDVSAVNVRLPSAARVSPDAMDFPSVAPLRIPGDGAEFFEPWRPANESGTRYRWTDATELEQTCAQAAAYRLEAVLAYRDESGRPARDAMRQLLDAQARGDVNFPWDGTVRNQVIDRTMGNAELGFEVGTMVAFGGYVVFVSAVNPDGSCDLPTLESVLGFADACLTADEYGDDWFHNGCR
ncbi:MAG: hypothetical protein AB7S26_37320 [Sandaracinaceae bacterium]